MSLKQQLLSLIMGKAIRDQSGKAQWTKWRDSLVRRWHDPIFPFPIRGRSLWINLSHELPRYLRLHAKYDTLILRLAQYLKGAKNAAIIDVGANIGDTVVPFLEGQILAIAVEPSANFQRSLEKNTSDFPNVVRLQVCCGTGEDIAGMQLLESNGTARLESHSSGQGMEFTTVDRISDNHLQGRTLEFLKVDTDGFDLGILIGARKSLIEHQPILLFEFDIFSNERFLEQLAQVREVLAEARYGQLLVYDNFGNLAGSIEIASKDSWQFLASAMASKTVYYWDLLAVPDRHGEFAKMEIQLAASELSTEKAKVFLDSIRHDGAKALRGKREVEGLQR